MSDKYMVEQVIKYSDGTETVLTYGENPASAQVEATVAEATDISEGVVTPEVEEVPETVEEEVSEEVSE